MSKIGYIRVSTEHQETAIQQEIMGNYQVTAFSPRKFMSDHRPSAVQSIS